MGIRYQFLLLLVVAGLLLVGSVASAVTPPECAVFLMAFVDEEPGFLSPLLENPDDRTTALVYADRLKERAESISDPVTRQLLEARESAIRLQLRIDAEPWKETGLSRWRLGRALGFRPSADPRPAELKEHLKNAGWGPVKYPFWAFSVQPRFTVGIPTRVHVKPIYAEQYWEDSISHQLPEEAMNRLLTDFPEVSIVTAKGLEGRNVIAAYPEVYARQLLWNRHPGVRAHFLHHIRDLKAPEVSWETNRVFSILLHFLHDFLRSRESIDSPVLATAMEVVRFVASERPAGVSTTYRVFCDRLVRMMDGKGDPDAIQALVGWGSPARGLLFDLAVKKLEEDLEGTPPTAIRATINRYWPANGFARERVSNGDYGGYSILPPRVPTLAILEHVIQRTRSQHVRTIVAEMLKDFVTRASNGGTPVDGSSTGSSGE